MTPKEKAKELIDKYSSLDSFDPEGAEWGFTNPFYHNAKQCAIIAVELALEMNCMSKTKEGDYEIVFHSIIGGIEFWNEVLTELNS